MPIIKSAKKRVKQAKKRQERNYPLRSLMKTHMKKVLTAAQEGKKEEAEKALPQAYKVIDTAAKKNIIHKKNAANKKSKLARAIARSGKVKPSKAPSKKTKKASPAKQSKKTESKETKK
ncbi:30S ribosomal protein S20 [Candidatus Peregrinibacteria bacterium]|nr:30S ribosomal protein S20 [Candidatus Peregrinibacteria bacterium]